MSESRQLNYTEAIQEAFDYALQTDPNVMLIGLGVPDPKGIFGTTSGLQEKFGVQRVLDMPVSENGMTGVAIGAALNGLRPVMMHQRLDFALLSIEQIVNQAAKWNHLFAGQTPVPLVIRLIVGRGWGQGPQHSQSLHSWFAHIPGLNVILPATPADAKGMMLAAIRDDNPIIMIEHRWLHGIHGPVPEGDSTVSLDVFSQPNVIRTGDDITIVTLSHMTLEAIKAAEILESKGIHAEVIDLRCLQPLQMEPVFESVRKTGHLLVADIGHAEFGVSGEIITEITKACWQELKAAPGRIGLPPIPVPTTASLANNLYPGVPEIVAETCRILGRDSFKIELADQPRDIPDRSCTGPC